jgi:hypothetical protein
MAVNFSADVVAGARAFVHRLKTFCPSVVLVHGDMFDSNALEYLHLDERVVVRQTFCLFFWSWYTLFTIANTGNKEGLLAFLISRLPGHVATAGNAQQTLARDIDDIFLQARSLARLMYDVVAGPSRIVALLTRGVSLVRGMWVPRASVMDILNRHISRSRWFRWAVGSCTRFLGVGAKFGSRPPELPRAPPPPDERTHVGLLFLIPAVLAKSVLCARLLNNVNKSEGECGMPLDRLVGATVREVRDFDALKQWLSDNPLERATDRLDTDGLVEVESRIGSTLLVYEFRASRLHLRYCYTHTHTHKHTHLHTHTLRHTRTRTTIIDI